MKTAVITPCGHFFHAGCLKKWLYVQETCPLCHGHLKSQPQSSNTPIPTAPGLLPANQSAEPEVPPDAVVMEEQQNRAQIAVPKLGNQSEVENSEGPGREAFYKESSSCDLKVSDENTEEQIKEMDSKQVSHSTLNVHLLS